MNPTTLRIAPLLALLVLAALSSALAQTPPPTEIYLPDGGLCLRAGAGDAPSYQGERLSYSCHFEAGLVGEPSLQGDQLRVERLQLDLRFEPPILLDRREVDGTVARILLLDGSVCLSTGHGATLAFGGRRLNYSCGERSGLIGDLRQQGATFLATRVTLRQGPQGIEAEGEQEVPVATLDARLPITASGWRLLAIVGGDGERLPAVAGAEPTLGLRAGGVNGSGGCNSYFGEARVGQDGAIRFSALGATLMACSEERMAQEARFLRALAEARFYLFGEGGELRLFGPDEVLLLEPIREDHAH